MYWWAGIGSFAGRPEQRADALPGSSAVVVGQAIHNGAGDEAAATRAVLCRDWRSSIGAAGADVADATAETLY